MKVETMEKKGFRPFRITIDVDNYYQLSALWHRFNISRSEVEKHAKETIETSEETVPEYSVDRDDTQDVWKVINHKFFMEA